MWRTTIAFPRSSARNPTGRGTPTPAETMVTLSSVPLASVASGPREPTRSAAARLSDQLPGEATLPSHGPCPGAQGWLTPSHCLYVLKGRTKVVRLVQLHRTACGRGSQSSSPDVTVSCSPGPRGSEHCGHLLANAPLVATGLHGLPAAGQRPPRGASEAWGLGQLVPPHSLEAFLLLRTAGAGRTWGQAAPLSHPHVSPAPSHASWLSTAPASSCHRELLPLAGLPAKPGAAAPRPYDPVVARLPPTQLRLLIGKGVT